MHKISGQNYNIVTSTLVRNYNIIIHKILCSRQKILYSKFKFTIFCALSLNHLWAEIEKIHKISGHNYDIAISTLVRNYNIIIYKISEFKNEILYASILIIPLVQINIEGQIKFFAAETSKILNIQKHDSVIFCS